MDLNIIDVVDIVTVALIMYYLYKLIKGTHATSIILGILLIYVIWIVVQALNMELLSAILGNITSVGIIAIIIIFQPELRRFLQVIGDSKNNRKGVLGKIFSTHHKQINSDYIKPLVQACGEMSSTKTGALIVIQQDGSLRDIIATGVRIDAILTPSLIKNIFFKNSPLHDGAMIVNGSRIVAAKCVLPSTQSEVPLSFGMRHRAALGMSEENDAIIVVVSEETGHIAIAHKGRVKSSLSSTELKAELMILNEASAEKE